MGIQLYLLDALTVNTPAEAEAFLTQESDEAASINTKFTAFYKQIILTYPDLSESDEDGDNDANIWEEGLDEYSSYGKVKCLVLKIANIDLEIVASIAKTAIACGLQCYDNEGQVLYRADGKCVDLKGNLFVF